MRGSRRRGQPRQLLDFTERTVELLGMGAIPCTIRPPRLRRNVSEQDEAGTIVPCGFKLFVVGAAILRDDKKFFGQC